MQRITLLIACVRAISFLVESSNIQLINGDHSCSGRVEIYYKFRWGTVCDDGWDINDAEVVCKQVGCGSAVAAFGAAHFGEGSGPMWLSNLDCSGSESSITQCANYRLHRRYYCVHSNDAGVECSVPVPDDSLLVDKGDSMSPNFSMQKGQVEAALPPHPYIPVLPPTETGGGGVSSLLGSVANFLVVIGLAAGMLQLLLAVIRCFGKYQKNHQQANLQENESLYEEDEMDDGRSKLAEDDNHEEIRLLANSV